MIYLAAALYAEAQPIIQAAGLKKAMDQTRFQLFQGDGLTAVLTGAGSVKAAVAVTWLFGLFPPSPSDYLINLGICGTACPNQKKGSAFLCHRITDAATGRTWYPDLLFPHPFGEASLTTVPRIREAPCSSGTLEDMEASGIFEAASFYLSPHQLIFLKIVSDIIGKGKPVLTQEAVTALTAFHTPAVLDWLYRLPDLSEGPPLNQAESLLFESAAKLLRLSATMKADLYKRILHNKYTAGTWFHIVNEFLHNQDKAILTKQERKKRFEQLKQLLS